MESLTISRVGFCQNCFDNPPQIGDLYVVYGGTSKELKIMKVLDTRKSIYRGFVPFLYRSDEQIVHGNVCVVKSCGVCGIEVFNLNLQQSTAKIDIVKAKQELMPVHEWHHLILFHADEYFL